MGKTANLELNTTEMSDKISDFVGEYNSNMNMLDDLYGDVQDDASSALSTAQSAETKATAAQTAATNAVTTAQSAVSTANSANTTAGQANTKADNAVATANTAKTTADAAKETAETASADVADKADVDGTYDSFTAGGAKQLLSTVYVDDNEPYNFRTAGGSADIGDRMYEEVVGGTVVWNQLVQNGNFTSLNNWTRGIRVASSSVSSNELVTEIMEGTTGGQANCYTFGVFQSLATVDMTHKYFVSWDVNSSVATSFRAELGGSEKTTTDVFSANTWNNVSYVNTPSRYNTSVLLYPWSAVSVDSVPAMTIKYRNVVCVDLTQMFGSTIADYIYSIEQGTAGAGVAWFRNLFPKPYYAYNAGELMSVKAGSHDTVGFNAWDEEWEQGFLAIATGLPIDGGGIRSKNFSPCVPNTAYTMEFGSGATRYVFWYDANKNFIESANSMVATRVLTSPSNAHFFKIRIDQISAYNNDVCIHLAWDGERNGEYEPYELHEYPLAELELRGIPKLDANNQLYYDGDTYASDGTVTRKYGIVDLGTLTWNRNGTGSPSQFFSQSIGVVTDHNGKNVICSKYNGGTAYYANTDKVVCADGGRVWITDSAYSEGSAFKTAMSGVYLVYELAEPTTETADTFVNPQVVDDFGTEEYVDFAVEAGDRDVAIPVGHNSQYMNNLRAKLEMAPESPSGDGKYIVQQSNGENVYIPYTADGRLDAIEAKLPSPPSANGTYNLTAVVSNNGVTYSWTT